MTDAPVVNVDDEPNGAIVGSSTTGESSSRLADLGKSPWVILTTLLIALAGLTLSIATTVSDRRVVVSMTAGYPNPWRSGALQVRLVNASARGTNVVGGDVRLAGKTIAVLTGVVAPPPSPVDPRADADVLQTAAALPYSLAPGQGAAMLLTFGTPPRAANDADLDGYNRVIVQPPRVDFSREKVTLRLDLDPGDHVEVDLEPPAQGRLPNSFDDRDTAAGWHASLRLAGGRRVDQVTIAPPSITYEPAGVATFRLWVDGGSTPFFHGEQPLLRGVGASFATPALANGSYRWSIEAAGAVVSIGQFAVPCPEASSTGPTPDHGDVLAEACRRQP